MAARGFTVELQRNIRELRDDGLTIIRYGDVIVDLMRPIIPSYERVLERAISAEILGQNVRISSAEGLLVMKLLAMRPQDEADIRDLLRAYRGELDLEFVRQELAAANADDDPRRARFDAWVRETSG